MSRLVDVIGSWSASLASLGAGYYIAKLGRRPAKPLELYDFEACPYCRKVREALSELDLEATIYPCPKGGTRFRPRAKALAGREQFPLLVDPNENVTMLESQEIVGYLARTYGAGPVSLPLRLGPVATLSSMVASSLRFGRGGRARPSRAPEQPLELWNIEVSPYCRLVREVLSELELPHLVHNVAKRSPSRASFVQRSRKMMVPYLADPNTGRELHESAEIVRYLEETYAA